MKMPQTFFLGAGGTNNKRPVKVWQMAPVMIEYKLVKVQVNLHFFCFGSKLLNLRVLHQIGLDNGQPPPWPAFRIIAFSFIVRSRINIPLSKIFYYVAGKF